MRGRQRFEFTKARASYGLEREAGGMAYQQPLLDGGGRERWSGKVPGKSGERRKSKFLMRRQGHGRHLEQV